MLKNIIAPVRAWLLAQKQCIGCGLPLKNGQKKASKNGQQKVVCQCGREYLFNKGTNKYYHHLTKKQ